MGLTPVCFLKKWVESKQQLRNSKNCIYVELKILPVIAAAKIQLHALVCVQH